MTIKELKRMHVVHEINAGRMTARAAREILGISIRQVRRLVKKQRTLGDAGLAHGNRGRSSQRKLETGIRERIVELAKGRKLG